MDLRPKRSATLPKKRSNAPAVNLPIVSIILPPLGNGTYEDAATIQVISALVIFKSLPANELMTVMEPVKKLVMATAMVAEITNRDSWTDDLKHSGRALGSLVAIGAEWWLPVLASRTAAMLQDSRLCEYVWIVYLSGLSLQKTKLLLFATGRIRLCGKSRQKQARSSCRNTAEIQSKDLN